MVVKKKDGTYIEIQVKSTTAEAQAGCFNVYDLEERDPKKFYVVCVNMYNDPPETWIIQNQDFQKYATITKTREGWKRYTLDINARDKRYDNQKRRDLLKDSLGAWGYLL